ncbi:MAG TPA: disulfide bond formation protein B [Candidatus Paceibacterota bacterium]|nr:disulfide bond formation protein B [Candidatus Paceibacterota bacterium]
MTETAAHVTDFLAFGTVLSLIAAAVIFALVALKRQALLDGVRAYVLPLAFVLTLGASLMSLVYSDLWGIAPCGLCWLQRALLYPMPIILGIALITKDRGVGKYILGLSIPGAVIALYQHLLQMGAVGELPCPAAPGAADCAQRIIFEFGFVTFPLMAAAAFVLAAALMLLMRK